MRRGIFSVRPGEAIRIASIGLAALLATLIIAPTRADQEIRNDSKKPQLVATLDGSAGSVLAFSKDGTKLLTAGGRQVRVWDASAFRPVAEPFEHDQDVLAAAMSPDGKQVVIASGKTVRLWDVQTKRQLLSIDHPDRVLDVAFSPDGQRLATACADTSARVWQADTGRQIATLAHTQAVLTVCFSPDGSTLLTSNAAPKKTGENDFHFHHGDAKLWEIQTARELWDEECDGRPVFSNDGKMVGLPDRCAYVFDAKTDECLAQWGFITGLKGITMMSFSRDGKFVLAAGDDGSDVVDAAARLLQLLPGADGGTTSKHFEQLSGVAPNQQLSAAAISPDGRLFATISSVPPDASSGLWNGTTGKQLLDFSIAESDQRFAPARERLVVFSPDGRYVAVSYVGGPPGARTFTNVWRVSQ